MCNISIDCKCDCEGTPSYRGCTLVYRCKVCGAYFRVGPWAELSEPLTPIAFHSCMPSDGFSYIGPAGLSMELMNGERFRGLGELIGVIWANQKDDSDESDK